MLITVQACKTGQGFIVQHHRTACVLPDVLQAVAVISDQVIMECADFERHLRAEDIALYRETAHQKPVCEVVDEPQHDSWSELNETYRDKDKAPVDPFAPRCNLNFAPDTLTSRTVTELAEEQRAFKKNIPEREKLMSLEEIESNHGPQVRSNPKLR